MKKRYEAIMRGICDAWGGAWGEGGVQTSRHREPDREMVVNAEFAGHGG